MPSFDPEQIKRAKRTGAERGAWFYAPAEVLRAAGILDAADGLAPFYRVYAGKRTVLVQLFTDKRAPARGRRRG